MIDIKRYLRAADRFQRAVRNYGILWTLENSIALLRRKLDARRARNLSADSVSMFNFRAAKSRRYHFSSSLVDEIGVVPSVRPLNEDDYAFSVPFEQSIEHGIERVAVIAHIFYVEYASEIRSYIENIPVAADVFISTNTEEKRDFLLSEFSSFTGGTVDVRVTPNKGRDIGPKLVGFSDVYSRYEYFLHLHSKRSPHGGEGLKNWRKYLYDHLLGSRDIVNSNLALLSRRNVGAVFPQHYFPLRGVLNWGYDFNFAKEILQKIGINLRKDNLLEFPSGSMFWGRSSALAPLLKLNLQFDDFEDEAGKIDGTLAHAIERSYLFFVEAAGFKWAKISILKDYPIKSAVLPVRDADDIVAGLKRVFNSVLSRPATIYSHMERAMPVCRRIVASPSDILRPRLNLLIPTINPDQIFGGVSTALKVFKALAVKLAPDFDVRIIVTDASVVDGGFSTLDGYSLLHGGDNFDHEEKSVIDLADRTTLLPLRKGDFFMASAWWNAAQAFDLKKEQEKYFSSKLPFIYLIQDFEPNFSAWSSQWAAAENTYKKAIDSIAIINSNELYAYMTKRYSFESTCLLPYVPNKAIVDSMVDVERKNQILIYGRPSVSRNCFELLLNGLAAWQARCPVEAAGWQIISLGEQYPIEYCAPVQNMTVLGKVDLATYGKILSESKIGISLMLSPHPSYPPLEMAQAGLLTITNTFESKDLTIYSDLISNIDEFESEALADSIERAVAQSMSSPLKQSSTSANLHVQDSCGPVLDYEVIAHQLRTSFLNTQNEMVFLPRGSPI